MQFLKNLFRRRPSVRLVVEEGAWGPPNRSTYLLYVEERRAWEKASGADRPVRAPWPCR